MVTKYLKKKKYYLLLDEGFHETLGLGRFFELQQHRDVLVNSLRNKDFEGFIDSVKSIINLQGDFDLSKSFPVAILVSMMTILSENKLDSEIAFLKPVPDKATEKQKPLGWSYSDRHVASYIHMLSKSYGWTLDEVLNINPNLAFYLIQEIIFDDFNEKEWYYKLTEFAYKYEEGSKTSSYVPLPRPYWMREEVYDVVPKKQRMLKSALPFGMIVDTTGMGEYGEKAEI